MRRSSATLLALALLAAAPLAHDFWVRPASYAPSSDSALVVRLFVGEHGVGEPVTRNEARQLRFALVDAGGERPIVGRDGAEPAGAVRLRHGGAGWLVFANTPAFIELEGAKFTEYLHTEGLEAISEARAGAGAEGAPAHEIYRRCAKALLHVRAGEAAAAPDDAFAARPLGLPLELVPLADPAGLRLEADGADLPLLLLWQGQPLADAQLKASLVVPPAGERSAGPAGGPLPFGAPAAVDLRVRTDAQGRATLHVPRGGAWYVGAVHMQPAEGGVAFDGSSAADEARGRAALPAADYESFWASLTCEIGAR